LVVAEETIVEVQSVVEVVVVVDWNCQAVEQENLVKP
jgi:hypothetical protein